MHRAGPSRRTLLAAAAAATAGATTLGAGPPLPRRAAAPAPADHPTPGWYTAARFGVFIHWGVYSVPAFGDAQWSSEWYFYGMNAPTKPGVYNHHRETYGPGFPYDAFIPRFTAEHYDPRAWVRLFRRAGARYFVLTSKHHDGFQLFRNDASDRNSVVLGPRRDLLGELFDAARGSGLKRGAYHSLGEFYNPALGTPPHNPYTGAPVEYTGNRPVGDYVSEYEHVHLRTLIDRYDPESSGRTARAATTSAAATSSAPPSGTGAVTRSSPASTGGPPTARTRRTSPPTTASSPPTATSPPSRATRRTRCAPTRGRRA